ncbi:fimbrial protein [Stenotrophomonas sp. NRRL B-14846]|uniref:fimbrial protein n=1 Tax=Stenotrophomonas sp. NRRL B-14846 TaxID=3162882 RepID=UPI003D283B1B
MKLLKYAMVIAGIGASSSALARCDIWATSYASPAVVVVANAAERGEALGAWHQLSDGYAGGCAPSSSGEHFIYETKLVEAFSYAEGGRTYSVYLTGVPGVGVIFGVEPTTDSTYRAYHEIRTGVPKRQSGMSGTAGDNDYLDQTLFFRFVKIGDTVPGTYATTAMSVFDYSIINSNTGATVKTVDAKFQSLSVIVDHRPLCHVQSKTVHMGVAYIDELSRVDATGREVDFTVEMNCEVDAGRVDYYLEEISPALDRRRGIISTEGEAVGFGLQLLDAATRPIEIGKAYPFGSSEGAGVRSLGFKARYIRTEKEDGLLQAGRADAQIRYRVDYP